MDFNIVTNIMQEDEEGNPVEGTNTVAHTGVIENGVFLVTSEYEDMDGSVQTATVLSQPYRPIPTGETEQWTSLEEAIEWFKDLSGHIGE